MTPYASILGGLRMDIQRKAYSQLLKWKNSTDCSKAILIKGAHRVGKSYLAEAFAKKEYASYILIDFASPLAGTKTIFEKYGNRQNLSISYRKRYLKCEAAYFLNLAFFGAPASRHIVSYSSSFFFGHLNVAFL